MKKYFACISLTKKSNHFMVAFNKLSPNFASNIKRINANQLLFLLKASEKHTFFDDSRGNKG